MWKFCGKAQFPHSFGRFTRHCVETVPFTKFPHQVIMWNCGILHSGIFAVISNILFIFEIFQILIKLQPSLFYAIVLIKQILCLYVRSYFPYWLSHVNLLSFNFCYEMFLHCFHYCLTLLGERSIFSKRHYTLWNSSNIVHNKTAIPMVSYIKYSCNI